MEKQINEVVEILEEYNGKYWLESDMNIPKISERDNKLISEYNIECAKKLIKHLKK